jgi:hypothetical protein
MISVGPLADSLDHLFKARQGRTKQPTGVGALPQFLLQGFAHMTADGACEMMITPYSSGS